MKSNVLLTALLLAVTIGLSACNTDNASKGEMSKTAATAAKPEEKSKESTEKGDSNKEHSHKAGGEHKDGKKEGHGDSQTVEIEGYHIELDSHKKDKVTHLDIAVQKGEKHEPVVNAQVKAQLNMPDGSSKTIELPYNAPEKTYGADISDLPSGDYKLVAQLEIEGKKSNARFSLKL